jgi:hypothetical protein
MTDLLQGLTNKATYRIVKGKEVVNATIDAIVENGKGVRHNLPDITTLESYRKDTKPIVFKNTRNIPVTNILESVKIEKNVEVGLVVTINNLRVMKKESYDDTQKAIGNDLEKWELDNRPALEAARKFLNSDSIKREGSFDLTQIARAFRDKNRFDQRLRNLKDHLQIMTDFTLEDGGIIRTIETPQTLNVEYDKILVDTNMLLSNNEPRFLAGNNQIASSKDDKSVPLLGRIPGVSYLFSNKADSEKYDSIIVFLTVTIKDDETDTFTAAAYSQLGQRFAIPMSMGGYAPNSVDSHPLKTGIRSKLKWMYEGVDGGVYGRAKRKLEAAIHKNALEDELGTLDSKFLRNWLSYRFLKKVYGPIKAAGMRQEEDWFNFSRLQYELDNLPGHEEGEIHPVVSTMKSIQKELLYATGVELSLTEILSIIRHENRMGRGLENDKADERLTIYLAYLIARDAEETDAFESKKAVEKFGKSYLPKFHKEDGAAYAAKKFEAQGSKKKKKFFFF